MTKDDLKISQSEFDKTKISRLSDRPNVGTAFGGQALSAQQLKERYDAAPALIRERFNALIDAMAGFDENGNRVGGVADLVMTGLGEKYTLADLFAGFASGEAMQHLKAGVGEYSVKGYFQHLSNELGEKLEAANVEATAHRLDSDKEPTVTVTLISAGEDIKVRFDFGVPSGGGADIIHKDAKTISEDALAIGPDCVAGCKGFRIVGARDAGGGIGYYKLEGYEKGYEVGKAVSMCIFKTDGNEYMYDRAGTIVGIAGNEIGVQFQGSVVEVQLIGNPIEDQNTLWVPEQPEVGIIDIGVCAVAMGRETFATGGYSSSEGRSTAAAGKYAHTEGVGTTANFAAHAEGRFTKATGQSSHSEGYRTEATGDKAHAEGSNATASGMSAHAEGNGTTASGARSHAEGENTNATAKAAHAEGNGSEATEEGSHAEGITTHATGTSAHAEGKNTNATANAAHAEGDGTKATNRAAHAEGVNTTASGNISHAEGYNTKATEEMAHAEGANTTASGKRSHAEGNGTTASGSRAHAEGDSTTASGMFSHAEGYATNANGDKSHAEGASTVASGSTSHAEGNSTHSKGGGSHAEGYNTIAKGDYSHTEGYCTISNGTAQHVQGKYNAEDTEGKYAFIIGNGGGENARSNAAAIRWDGTLELGGVAISPAQLQKLLELI